MCFAGGFSPRMVADFIPRPEGDRGGPGSADRRPSGPVSFLSGDRGLKPPASFVRPPGGTGRTRARLLRPGGPMRFAGGFSPRKPR